jgi:hypothetical protein
MAGGKLFDHEDELGEIESAIGSAPGDDGRLVYVKRDAGIGKSRLLEVVLSADSHPENHSAH